MNAWSRALPLVFVCVLPAVAAAQQPPASSTPAPGDLDLRFIRMKISAGDLPSAESILEVHRAEKGEDSDYLLGLAWLARGAALTGDWKAAAGYAKSARELARSKLSTATDFESHREAVYALGT